MMRARNKDVSDASVAMSAASAKMRHCLRIFRRCHFPPLHTVEFAMATRECHTYSFYRRPRENEFSEQPGQGTSACVLPLV